ncbi:MAG: hypothetical protein V4657_09405 [Pseudomonadota bacterium]
METKPVWPVDGNGSNLRFGDMTKKQQDEQAKWAARRIKTEMEHPKFAKALGAE